MVRKSSLLIGFGLGFMWWFGLSQDRSATILWFDAVGAVLAFGIAGLVDESGHNPSRAVGPAVLGLGLGVVWIVGMARHQPAWVNWMNFLFAVACLGVAIVAAGAQRTLAQQSR